MQWILAFHIIFVVCWFSGIFYLPRLFVYHAQTTDTIGRERFKVMERKLYYFTTPFAILATLFGILLITFNPQYYAHAAWFHLKMFLVMLLWVYHIICGYYLKQFALDQNRHTHVFYRVFNELPVIILFAAVILVVVKPVFA
ncbi:MAG: CopD family protein, partial [Legionellales bacterium]|nr:CopD family protein [Legionellales bacterium]